MNIDWKKSVIVLSGGFDPIHKGHMRMFREAANLGHQVIVGLNSDEWLTRKKGKPFMKFYERKEILEGIKYISSVVKFDDNDDTACSLIHQVRSTYNSGMFNHDHEFNNPTGRNDYQIFFANGGDRTTDNVPELNTCRELSVTMLWGIGGGKVQSSSWLIDGKNDEVDPYLQTR